MFVLFEHFKVKIWQELEFRNAFEILSCVPTRWTWIAQNWTKKSLHSVAFISQILYCLRRAKLWNFAKFYKTFSIFKNISFAKYCESWFGLKKFPKIEENKNIFEATRLYCTVYNVHWFYPLYLFQLYFLLPVSFFLLYFISQYSLLFIQYPEWHFIPCYKMPLCQVRGNAWTTRKNRERGGAREGLEHVLSRTHFV